MKTLKDIEIKLVVKIKGKWWDGELSDIIGEWTVLVYGEPTGGKIIVDMEDIEDIKMELIKIYK